MSGKGFWNPVRRLDMFDFSDKLDWKEFFDDLYFTNSQNVSPLDSSELLKHK
jgi:hypothetical protein